MLQKTYRYIVGDLLKGRIKLIVTQFFTHYHSDLDWVHIHITHIFDGGGGTVRVNILDISLGMHTRKEYSGQETVIFTKYF